MSRYPSPERPGCSQALLRLGAGALVGVTTGIATYVASGHEFPFPHHPILNGVITIVGGDLGGIVTAAAYNYFHYQGTK